MHCTAGMDRAPFVVAWWMATDVHGIEGFNLIEDGRIANDDLTGGSIVWWMGKAYEFIKKKRPQIRMHMEWV